MIKNIIFDLDGTISKSADGILNAFEYALDKMGKAYDRDELFKYIGPPLRDSFVKELGEDLADDGVEFYRSYYFEKGKYEASIYDGMKDVIKNLYDRGYKIYLATSKGRNSSLEVLESYGILQYFSNVEGSTDILNTKKKVLENVIIGNKLKKDQSLMIGDRSYDIDAGFDLGIKTIAASYGYGKDEEYKNASFIAHSPTDIESIIENI